MPAFLGEGRQGVAPSSEDHAAVAAGGGWEGAAAAVDVAVDVAVDDDAVVVRGHFKLSCAYTFTHSAKYPASQDRVLATNPRDALSGGPTVFTGVLVRPALTGIAHAAIKT